jgi:hypothetical protein
MVFALLGSNILTTLFYETDSSRQFRIAEMYQLKCEPSICSLRGYDKADDNILSCSYKTGGTVKLDFQLQKAAGGHLIPLHLHYTCFADGQTRTLKQKPPTKGRQVNRNLVIRTDKQIER